MAHSQRKLMSTLSLGVAAVMLSGCGHGTAAVASRDTTTHPTQAAGVGGEVTPVLTPDIRACAEVQAVIGHLTVDTVRWSPNLDPFDKAISTQIRLLSQDLAKQAPHAQTQHIRTVVNSNAQAFRAVADAMGGKSSDKVSRAIYATRVAYRDLKKACSLK
jgi:hypothetical protein